MPTWINRTTESKPGNRTRWTARKDYQRAQTTAWVPDQVAQRRTRETAGRGQGTSVVNQNEDQGKWRFEWGDIDTWRQGTEAAVQNRRSIGFNQEVGRIRRQLEEAIGTSPFWPWNEGWVRAWQHQVDRWYPQNEWRPVGTAAVQSGAEQESGGKNKRAWNLSRGPKSRLWSPFGSNFGCNIERIWAARQKRPTGSLTNRPYKGKRRAPGKMQRPGGRK